MALLQRSLRSEEVTSPRPIEEIDEGRRRRRPSAATVVTAVVAVAAGVYILLQLQPGLIVANTTPAGGDMGAHVWGPAYLRDYLLPHGRITGWTPDWYAGFPALHYYFPLPSLLIVLVDVVLPYGVAFKVVTVLGLVAMPAAAATLGRQLRLPFPTPALMAAAIIPFVFDRFHTIWGGNAAATLAGEFAFSISLALALFFLAALARALETGRGRALAGALFAATALCHLLPAAFAVAAAGILLLTRRPDRARWGILLSVGLIGFALSAFWFVPFIGRLEYSNDMGWERTFAYVENLLPFLRTDDAAASVVTRHLKFVFPMAAVGVLLGLAARRRGVVALAGIAALCALGFRFVPDGPIWNARFLPFWYLSAYLLAAVGVAELTILLRNGFARLEHSSDLLDIDAHPGPATFIAALGGLASAIVLTGVPLGLFATGRIDLPGDASVPFLKATPEPDGKPRDSSFVPSWAKWNYSGYERKADYPEFREVISTMEEIGRTEGCGRAMWEYEPELNRFGTPMALMLLPYYTEGCIGSMEGLFFESSATVPYHFLNQSELSKTPSRAMRDLPYRDLDLDAGVQHLQLLGVRYYMAVTPEAQAAAAVHPDLDLITTTTSRPVKYPDGVKDRTWQIYEVQGADLVVPMAFEPVVAEGLKGRGTKETWLDAAVDWYQDRSRQAVPLADDGPSSWARIPSASASAPASAVREADVSKIRSDDDGITFDVDRPGTPVVVRASYFPNWKAKGADGPWRIAPNLMVVVPTSTSVELRYGWTPLDLGAWGITFVGMVGLVLLVRRGRVVLPAKREPDPKPPADETYDDPFFVEQPTAP